MKRKTYLSRVDDGDLFGRRVSSGLGNILDGPDNVHTLQNITEDDLEHRERVCLLRAEIEVSQTYVSAVQPRRDGSGDEELGTIGVFARVGHAQLAGAEAARNQPRAIEWGL